MTYLIGRDCESIYVNRFVQGSSLKLLRRLVTSGARCSRCDSIESELRYNLRKTKVAENWISLVVDEDVRLDDLNFNQFVSTINTLIAYRFEIPMYHVVFMEILQAFSDACDL